MGPDIEVVITGDHGQRIDADLAFERAPDLQGRLSGFVHQRLARVEEGDHLAPEAGDRDCVEVGGAAQQIVEHPLGGGLVPELGVVAGQDELRLAQRAATFFVIAERLGEGLELEDRTREVGEHALVDLAVGVDPRQLEAVERLLVGALGIRVVEPVLDQFRRHVGPRERQSEREQQARREGEHSRDSSRRGHGRRSASAQRSSASDDSKVCGPESSASSSLTSCWRPRRMRVLTVLSGKSTTSAMSLTGIASQ